MKLLLSTTIAFAIATSAFAYDQGDSRADGFDSNTKTTRGYDGVSNFYGGRGWEHPQRPGQMWDKSNNPVRVRSSGKWHLAWNPDTGRVAWFHGFVDEVTSTEYRRLLRLGEHPTHGRLRQLNNATSDWNAAYTVNYGSLQDATNGCGNCQ